MAITLETVVGLISVALLWGTTNPFMKKGAQGIEAVKSHSATKQFFNDVFFLVTNYKYMVPFLINQGGSLLYIFILQNVDLSLTVVVVNSLTFVITALTGIFLGEEKVNKVTYAGVLLILIGTTLCCLEDENIK